MSFTFKKIEIRQTQILYNLTLIIIFYLGEIVKVTICELIIERI